jgi:2-oxoglutarate dehydrogenase E1 component
MSLNDLPSQNLGFVEALYEDFLRDPTSVSEQWKAYFTQLRDSGLEPALAHGPARLNALPRRGALRPPTAEVSSRQEGISIDAVLQHRVDQLVRSYRVLGHLAAQLDPLGLPRPAQPELELAFHGLSESDLELAFTLSPAAGTTARTLREIVEHLRETYCRSIGVQFMHIDDLTIKDWIQARLEAGNAIVTLSREEQVRILTKLTDAVMLEEFVQRKYLGAKSFSLEGSESLIPLLTVAVERAALQGTEEVVLAMAHRGRLNVLANVIGKSPRDIFREFEDIDPELYIGSGDVKYHLGHSTDYTTSSGRKVHLSLCFNPSHLEYVNPVAMGRVRAKQDRAQDNERARVLAILIHGDAAFAGEGIVAETLNLGELAAYTIGGAIHVIVNNQIGFTTSPAESRSTVYATDVAKMLQSPIFHVNGEDPEAVARVIQLAMDFRAAFHRDVIVDMYGYRRHGHNEGDEPAFTQPLLYAAIAARSSVRDGYLEHLLRLGGIKREDADRIAVERRDHLEAELAEARRKDFIKPQSWLDGQWKGYKGGSESDVADVDTSLPAELVTRLCDRLATTPEGFHPHKKIERILEQRKDMGHGGRPFDWGTAELLALGSLAAGGTRVRMSGQDCSRGTFSHRHAVLHDVVDGHRYYSMQHLADGQSSVQISNSPLSEAAVLGFEYGYSLDSPDVLVMWEAQFGDFINCAQVIVDQFIVSAEDKWKRLSGVVLLLPHGYEGMGPEHSSGRLERMLLLAAEENIQVAQPTTPAQYFHLLRRQVLRKLRKPLIVFTPKSLLRHPAAVSDRSEFCQGRFRRVLPDPLEVERRGKGVERVLLCSGKAYYALENKRSADSRGDVAIIRLEQLYPLPDEYLRAALAPFAPETPVYWVKEEPENMGPWRHLRARFGSRLFATHPLSCVARAESASPATGSANSHRLEQDELLEKAFGTLV